MALPAGAALLCSALAQLLTSRDVELPSETICWVVLPALVELTRRWGGKRVASKTLLGRASGAVASTRAWLFALGVAVACLYRAEEQVVVLFVSHPFYHSSGKKENGETGAC